uniref:Immunoglobulin V-set domain-containing protein n=1 Tax=Cyanistes caeruleus TaxID=156563 RepID=A0A8C0U2P0_CYACU
LHTRPDTRLPPVPCAYTLPTLSCRTTGQITVTQDDGQVMVKQGHPFQTTCKYHSQAPQLLSYQAGSGPKHSGRITTHLNTTGKYSVLKVEEVQLSDTALYLCAPGRGGAGGGRQEAARP